MDYRRNFLPIRPIDPPLAGQGRLQIAVFAGDVGKPASNAVVRVTQKGGKAKMMEELTTDASGHTPEINLKTPPLDYSMQAEQPQPYSEYDIHIRMEGYETATIEGLQVLPDSTACQDVSLKPVSDDGVHTRGVHIKKHMLWGTFPTKIPEPEAKELPESLGSIAQPQPVIPEYVVVHDGDPADASAPNYRVPFKEYIKNVASCEIYPTWPEAAIRANVMAILSFTLNRIYTQWYSGKGYDFTITGSTAFDQAFSYGRNFFQEISQVVDDIFTTFVARPDIRQPLLTQYCDGAKVSCPNWMTKWGAKALGDQGYAPADILKNYYGQDIVLMQAEEVAGAPSPFPGAPLQIGSVSRDVRTVQEQLNAIAGNYPAMGKMEVDGIFGQETGTAVGTFQSIFRLPSTGIVDFAAWHRIADIHAAVMRMAEPD